MPDWTIARFTLKVRSRHEPVGHAGERLPVYCLEDITRTHAALLHRSPRRHSGHSECGPRGYPPCIRGSPCFLPRVEEECEHIYRCYHVYPPWHTPVPHGRLTFRLAGGILPPFRMAIQSHANCV